ncbi:MAG: PQQ-dependent sugar dehydrogenase [Thermoleophilaceae bacterium]
MRPAVVLVFLLALLSGCGGDEDTKAPAPPQAETAPAEPTQTPAGAEPLRAENNEARLETVATGLEAPWEIAFLPDRSALVTERPGRVRLLGRNGKLDPDPVAEVEVAAFGEGGLLGLAVDPRFRRNRFVYLYRSTDSGNEVLRYRFEGGKLTEDAVVLDGIEAGAIHNGGRMHFGPDGSLYVSTGETGDPGLAQDPDSLNGKILRLANPRGASANAEVVSLGHRNVQGFDWDAQGRLFATEFGPDSDDEVNLIEEGKNYGWPEAQGEESENGSVPALVNYEDVIAPSGATFVSMPGSAWSGDFLFANLVGEQVRRVTIDGTEGKDTGSLFEGDLGRLRTVVEGPDGGIYALTNNTDGRGSPRDGDDKVVRIVPPAG